MLAASPRRQMLPGRGLPFPSLVLVLVSRSPFVPVPFSFWLLVLASPHPLLWCPDPSSVNPEDVDAVIEDVAKAAKADGEKITAEEAAKGAAGRRQGACRGGQQGRR